MPSCSNEKKRSALKGRFGGDVNINRVAKQSFASPFIRKNATLEKVSRLCLNLTDYQTFKTDFLKLVEFSQWVRENYPDKVPLN